MNRKPIYVHNENYHYSAHIIEEEICCIALCGESVGDWLIVDGKSVRGIICEKCKKLFRNPSASVKG